MITSNHEQSEMNAALYLRRPLLVTVGWVWGKSALAYQVTHELRLGECCGGHHQSYDAGGGLYRCEVIGRVRRSPPRANAAQWAEASGDSLAKKSGGSPGVSDR